VEQLRDLRRRRPDAAAGDLRHRAREGHRRGRGRRPHAGVDAHGGRAAARRAGPRAGSGPSPVSATALARVALQSLLSEREAYDCERQLFAERTASAAAALRTAHAFVAEQLKAEAGHRLEIERSALGARRASLRDRTDSVLGQLRSAQARTSEQLAANASCVLDAAQGGMEDANAWLRDEATHALTASRRVLRSLRMRLAEAAPLSLANAARTLEQAGALVEAHDPLAVLRRVYSVTIGPAGTPVTDASSVEPGSRLTTLFAHGRLSSTVDDDFSPVSHG
jgi:hypothetical protein